MKVVINKSTFNNDIFNEVCNNILIIDNIETFLMYGVGGRRVRYGYTILEKLSENDYNSSEPKIIETENKALKIQFKNFKRDGRIVNL